MSLVVDASVVVAALIDSGPIGDWAEGVLASDSVLAPHLMPAEVSNILRRAVVAGDIPADAATLAHADLGDLTTGLAYQTCRGVDSGCDTEKYEFYGPIVPPAEALVVGEFDREERAALKLGAHRAFRAE